ncbi:sugar ABC transporter permease [Mycoplasmatota bacterium]|nr:sugar ABC transporter permease [Mycoplasmatota bacterium]
MKNIINTIKPNIREYGMYIALITIWVFFDMFTGGLFLSSRNMNNLFLQTGYIAVLGIGVTLVIIIRHIDLSIGFGSGFLGAIAVSLLINSFFPLPIFIVIPLVLVLGVVVGLFNGFLISFVKIPSFVATLAGMLIFRGGLLLVTKSETLLPKNDVLQAIGSGYIWSFGKVGEYHLLTLIIGLLGIGLIFFMSMLTRTKKQRYGFEVASLPLFIIKMAVMSGAILYITLKLAEYKGLSWTVVIVLIVTIIYHLMTNHTVIGRHIYAVGGNPEAAKLSGISVQKITLYVFGSMGLLTALSGILFTARLNSVGPQAGEMFELDAIAAAYIGGVSAAGGVGKVTGAIIGALVMASLSNGMNLMNVGISWQYVIRGSVLVTAVIFDVMTRNMKVSN